jgi:hypothetical protein
MRELGRWILAAAAVGVVFFVTLYFSVFVLMFGAFPKDLADPTAGFLMGLLVVLTGSLLAPRHRFITAVVLLVSNTVLTTVLVGFHFWGTLAGGVLAVAFVAWWFHSRRTPRSIIWVGISACVAFFVFIGVVYARFVDRPARPDALSPQLVHALGTNASLVTAFYRYDLGGFIDHEWLWRIDAKPEAVALVVSSLGLRSTNAVPRDFWRMPPHYWPRSMPANGEAFQSPMFSADSRGPDGAHYFLIHDKTHNQAFVWVKDNF